VTLIADADNARGIRCYEKCGFVREAVLRGHRLRYGRPLDMIAMGVLREDSAARGRCRRTLAGGPRLAATAEAEAWSLVLAEGAAHGMLAARALLLEVDAPTRRAER
jgi:hypothetical protein